MIRFFQYNLPHGSAFFLCLIFLSSLSTSPRPYVGFFRRETLLTSLQSKLENVKAHDFQILDLEPHEKDGGVYVKFAYTGADSLPAIEKAVRDQGAAAGGFPGWLGLNNGQAWLVQGSPWKEDMRRFASPIVKVMFDGPDVKEQELYDTFRPYGRIKDIVFPATVPSGQPRYATITFQHLHSAAIARNVLYGLNIPTSSTRIRTVYQQPIQAHAVRDWMSSHPKIVLPLLVFLLGSLSYAVSGLCGSASGC